MKQLPDKVWELEHRLETKAGPRQKQVERQQQPDTRVDRGISLFDKTTEWWKADEIPPTMSDYL
jgi:hypothetical protein